VGFVAMAEVVALLLAAKIASVLQVPSIQLASDCLLVVQHLQKDVSMAS
jgi:hypothetical protein